MTSVVPSQCIIFIRMVRKWNKSALTILANFLYSCVFYLKPQCNNSSGLLIFILYLSHKEEMVGWCFIKFSPIFLEI